MNLAQKQPLLNKADRCVVSSKDLAAFRARIIQIKSEDDDFYQAGMQFEPGEPEKALEGVWQELLKGKYISEQDSFLLIQQSMSLFELSAFSNLMSLLVGLETGLLLTL